MAVGGSIRVANGSRIVGGLVVSAGVYWKGIGATQVLEYMRGFLATRIAWSEMNALLIISGAFGVFQRDLLVALGGFSRATLGEDMEMTMRIHHLLRSQWKDARVGAMLIEEIGVRRYRAIDMVRLTDWGGRGVALVPSGAGVVASAGNDARAHRPSARLGHDPSWRGHSRAPGGGRRSPYAIGRVVAVCSRSDDWEAQNHNR
jgi:hypothetical protein